jgi:hypothetical protein
MTYKVHIPAQALVQSQELQALANLANILGAYREYANGISTYHIDEDSIQYGGTTPYQLFTSIVSIGGDVEGEFYIPVDTGDTLLSQISSNYDTHINTIQGKHYICSEGLGITCLSEIPEGYTWVTINQYVTNRDEE